MATYAIDASTVLASVLNEAHTPAATGFLDALRIQDELVAPGLLLAECTSNIRELVFTGALSASEGTEAVEKTLRLPIRPLVALEHHRLAMRIAQDRGTRKAYDAHYLAVAAIFEAELVTIDGGIYQAAVERNIRARLLR